MASFPLAAPAFDGKSRRVVAASALAWIRQGWAIYAVDPGTWMAIMLILLPIPAALALLPPIGHLLFVLLAPLLVGGMLFACRHAAREQAVRWSELFAGLRRNTPGLLALGALYLGAGLLIVVALALSGANLAGGRPETAPALAGSRLFGPFGLASLLVAAALLMATGFAPALVLFNRMPPLRALKTSVSASLKNLPALLFMALLGGLPCLVAALPFGLGFIFLGPVVAGSMYASYHDIFLGD
ncbi:MAG: BPSS1780 family membrane protein [Candidatus Accumulibacter sp.]|uniref:BPSS1780 family membrane protein n=1 Tax=Accumulibacter sp. TaxID=2053492 RepID=UPI00287B1DF1|nr:BPSS1780 family membrane protein [Accumulibacter sp.]MDS4013450.1 BPSS1780 family membrane protein [Accumulibacter sp.]